LFKAFVLRGASPLRFAGSSRFGFNVAGDKGVTALAAGLRGAASCVARGIRPTVAEVIQFAVMAMHHTQQFLVISVKQVVSTFDTYCLLVIPSGLNETMTEGDERWCFSDYENASFPGFQILTPSCVITTILNMRHKYG